VTTEAPICISVNRVQNSIHTSCERWQERFHAPAAATEEEVMEVAEAATAMAVAAAAAAGVV
jgi:hypothetical protein